MKIVLLWTGRGLRPESIDELRANMGMSSSDQVCLVTWRRSGLPLPVSRHLVIGPHLWVGRELATDQGVQQHDLITPVPVDVAHTLEAIPLVEAIPRADAIPLADEATAKHAEATKPTVAPAKAANNTAHLPVLHPRRMRQAVVWRARRAKRAASKRGIRRHPLFRALRGQLSLGTSLGFATNCLRARKAHDMLRDADLVVALDTASHRGAWTLAQKVPGPDVVIGIPAAKRLLEQRRLRTQTDADVTRRSPTAS